jgi:crotonobetainyl-CoA:carnitine CoA-transferase CaiB-like acyl-CoA transferase
MSHGPLHNTRILDLTRVASGPFATMLLADLGAEVIKVERIGVGDEIRTMGKPLPGGNPDKSDYYLGMNRSKKSIAIDLAQPAGSDIARALATMSDIVIQNFRPGVADRLGLGFDDLRRLRPNLVYTSISGFGSSGPWADLPANDIMMQSLSGLMGITGERNGAPVRLGTSICDLTTGLFALQVSMLEAAVALMPNLIPAASLGERPERMGRGHPQIMGYASFECADGGFVTVGAFSETFWHRLCKVLDHEEWISDPRFATNADRLAQREILDPDLEACFLRRTRNQWIEILQQADVPCAPVYELDEAISSEQALHSEMIWTLNDGTRDYGVIRNPIRCDAWPPPEPTSAEDLGHSSLVVLEQLLAMDMSRIVALVNDGVVGVSTLN